MMGFPGIHIPFQGSKILSDFEGFLEVPGVLTASLINIAGKHPEIRISKKKDTQKVRPSDSKQGQPATNQRQNHDKLIQLIIPVSSNHKSVQFFSHGNTLQNKAFLLSYFYLTTKSIKPI